MTIHVTPIPSIIELTTPAFVLGTTNAAGDAGTAVASNSTLAAFSSQVPTTINYDDTAATGNNVYASREDHEHGMVAGFTASQVIAYGYCIGNEDRG